jgi:hypothetical protein
MCPKFFFLLLLFMLPPFKDSSPKLWEELRDVSIAHFCICTYFKHCILNFGSVLLHTTKDVHFFFLIMFPLGFQYLVIIYINFKFNLNYIKCYIHGGKVKERGSY